MAISCTKCKSLAEIRDTIQCSICKKRFHYECSGYPVKLGQSMTTEKKKQWKCNICIRKGKYEIKKQQHSGNHNMTTRKIENNQKIHPTTSISTPTLDDNSLESTLLSKGADCNAHTPIVIGTNSEMDLSVENNVTIRTRQVINVPTQNSFSHLSDSFTEEADEDSTSLNRLSRSYQDLTKCTYDQLESLQLKVLQLEEKLESADQQIEELLNENFCLKKKSNEYEETIKNLRTICRTTPSKGQNKTKLNKTTRQESYVNYKVTRTEENIKNIGPCNSPDIESPKPNTRQKLSELNTSNIMDDTKKGKVLLLSSNKTNNILKIAQRTLEEEYNVCHYLLPNSGLQRLTEGIGRKLEGFTRNDYCVILLGEQDFHATNVLSSLVKRLRDTLSSMYSTNILICSPTFKYSKYSNMFNSRIETFNELLNRDVIKFEYAYLIDSNLNLTYDRKMFHLNSGKVNNRGMLTIFDQIKSRISEIREWHDKERSENITSTPISSQPNQRLSKCFRP